MAGITKSRQNEAKFRLLFENSPDAMLLLDEDVFVDCDQAAVEMMRCAGKEQLLALDLYDISPARQPDGRLSSERAHDLVAAAFREGSLHFEWVHHFGTARKRAHARVADAVRCDCGRQQFVRVGRNVERRAAGKPGLRARLGATGGFLPTDFPHRKRSSVLQKQLAGWNTWRVTRNWGLVCRPDLTP